MRIVIQRVSSGGVIIGSGKLQSIAAGLVALVGFNAEDSRGTVDYMVEKMINLRIFDDENGQLNRSVLDINGEILVVSNFTLYANSKKGRRPSFVEAAQPSLAAPLYDYTVERLKSCLLYLVTGEFGGDMQVIINNDGPVTIILDSDDLMPKERKTEI